MTVYKLSSGNDQTNIDLWYSRALEVYNGYQLNIIIDNLGNLVCNLSEALNENYPFMSEISICEQIEFIPVPTGPALI